MELLKIALSLLAVATTLTEAGQAPSKPKEQQQQQASSVVAEKTGRILFYMPLTSKSMKITFMPLAESLAERGHQVVVLMPHQATPKSKNLQVVTVDSEFEALTEAVSKDLLKEGAEKTVVDVIGTLLGAAVNTNDNALGDDRFRKLLEKKFDVVLVSPFLCSEAGYHLAHRSDAALVMYFTGQVSFSMMDWAMGMPHNPAYLPFALMQFQAPMNFFQRVVNTIGTVAFQLIRDFYMLRKGEELLDKHFPGEPRVPLQDLERNASLALHYGHPLIMDGMRPLSPSFQYIGMMNCRDPEPLPKDLADFMSGKEASEHGVVYVSFGSVLKAKEMGEGKRRMLLNVFKGLKQRVIWKWETEEMADKPDNVKLSKWLPQQDILGHPNTVLFITHAGQSSSQETLCHQKPVVAIPVTGDQPANAKEAERVGFGKAVSFQDLTEENLRQAVKEVLENPKYTEVAQEHGSILNDQITRPLDRAVWWLEFLIRHPGKNHMRSPVHDLAWYQYFLLDVILFLLAVVFVVGYILIALCRCLCCRGKKAGTPPAAVDKKKKRN